MTKDRKALTREAAKAHTDLTMFWAVIAMLEGGTVSGAADPDANKIVRLCKNAAAKCLSRYDAAVAKIEKA